VTTPVVVDASAGVEILTSTERGRGLAGLVPRNAELWVPEHFYAEVLGVLRHLHVVVRSLPLSLAEQALDRLSRWHLHQVAVPSLLRPAWALRHNMTGADALYVALAQHIGGRRDSHRRPPARQLTQVPERSTDPAAARVVTRLAP